MSRCFPKKIAEWVKPEATKEETLNVVNELVRSHKNLLELYEAALAASDINAAIRALEVERRHLELYGKITGQLNEPQTQIDILVQPELVRLEQAVIKFVPAEKRVEFSEWLKNDDNHN